MKEVPVLSDECKDAFKNLSSINIKNCQDFDTLAKVIGYTDETFVNFLKDASYSEKNLENYQQYLSKASTANAKFAASLKSIAANISIMLIINFAIKGLAKLWDFVNETVEEQEQKISKLKSSYESLKSEYDELSQKQDITDAEKRRLEYLERRLELDERILKAEQTQLFDEKTGKKFTDLFDKDNLNTQYLAQMNYQNKDGYAGLKFKYNNQIDGIDDVHDQIARLKELQAAVKEGSNECQYYQNSISAAINKETKYIDSLSESESHLTINLGKYADNIAFLQSQLDSEELTEGQTATANEQLKIWQNLYDDTDAMIIQIQKLNGTYDDTGERIAQKYSTELNKAKTSLGGYDYSDTGTASTNDTGQQISDFWDKNVLSGTEEEIEQNVAFWNKVTVGIEDATEAMNAYTKAKENGVTFSPDGSPLSFDQVWTNSFTSENETVRELGNSLLELAQKGRLTVDTFNTADSTRYFTSFGISADEAVAKINQLADKSNQLSSMSGQISKMSAALSAKKKNGFVDADALSGFDTKVRSLESWNTFQETLGSTASSYSECQEAANALATEWVNSSDFLNQLTEGNREYYETQLESMGIANAEEIVMQSLAEAKANAFLASYDLANATDDEVIAMLNEAESAGIASDMIFKLVAEEQIFNAQGLSTEEKVAQLKKLADTYGQTAVAAKIARMEEEYTKSHQPINYEEIAKAASAEINNAVNSVHVGFKGVGNGRKSSGGSGSSKLQTERDTTKEYNWIEQAIENVEKEIKTLDETASSSYASLSRKNEALTNEIGKVTEEIELQQKAYEEYMRKADSIGLPDSYKELVQNGAAGIEDIKDEKLQEQIDGYQKWYEKAQNASDAIRELNTDLKDLRVESYKLQTETLKDRLDSESITEKQYLTELKAAYEQFYGNLSEYAEQYHEAKLEYLKEEKKYLNSVANAATSVLDTEIDRIREDAEKQEEQLKTQAELLEAGKKPLQEELEALDEKTRKEELAFHLQKAQYDLARAENQQTKLVYTADKGMIYTSDSTAIRDARKGLDDAKSEIHKQSIQDQIDALDDEISRYDDLIDQINKAADAQVKALEQFKAKWQEVIDVQEQAKNITILTGEFGADAVAKILSGKDGDLLAQWKDSYLDTLKSIDLESQGYIGEMTKQVETFYQHSAKALSDAAGKAADAANAAAARNNLNLLDHPITLENGTVLTPLQPGDRGYDLLLKTKPLTDKIMRGEMDIISNAVFEGQRQMEQWAKTINYSNIINHVANNVTNNRNAQPNINIGDIYVTCPGVTEQQVARHIGPALVRELNREFQGLHVYADQMSRDKTY